MGQSPMLSGASTLCVLLVVAACCGVNALVICDSSPAAKIYLYPGSGCLLNYPSCSNNNYASDASHVHAVQKGDKTVAQIK